MLRVVRDPEQFAAEHWGREPLFTRDTDGRGFEDLLSPAAVDDLVSRRGLRTPFLRVAKDGVTLGDKEFTSSGGIGAGIADQVDDDKLLRLFGDGATLVLQGLHRTHPPLIEFSQALAQDLGHPVQVNAYVTPPQSQGFSDHYDVHDVFVLQVAGAKRWRIRPPVLPLPTRDQPWSDRSAEVAAAATTPPLVEETFRPGDSLYLPRGYLHSATALGGVSIHLTVGVQAWTRQHLAEELLGGALASLRDDLEHRTSLPLGVDVADPEQLRPDLDAVRVALAKAVQDLDAGTVAAALGRRARRAQRPAPVGPLSQVAAAQAVDGIRTLRLRPHLAATLTDHGAYAALVTRAGTLRVQREDVAAVLRLLEDGQVDVAEVGTGLARRMLLAGIAVPGHVVPPPTIDE